MKNKKQITKEPKLILEQMAVDDKCGIIVYKDSDGELIIAEKLNKNRLSGRQFKAMKAFQFAVNFAANEEAMGRFGNELEKLGRRIESCEKVSNMVQDKMDKLYHRKPRFGWRDKL